MWKEAFAPLVTADDDPWKRPLPTNHKVADWCDKNAFNFDLTIEGVIRRIIRAPPPGEFVSQLCGILFLSLGGGGHALKTMGHFVAWCVPFSSRKTSPAPKLLIAAPPSEAEIQNVD